MTKRSTRTVLFSLLICLSIASYAYVNLQAQPILATTQDEQMEEVKDVNEEVQETNSLNLPDVQMVRKVIDAGRRFLPAS